MIRIKRYGLLLAALIISGVYLPISAPNECNCNDAPFETSITTVSSKNDLIPGSISISTDSFLENAGQQRVGNGDYYIHGDQLSIAFHDNLIVYHVHPEDSSLLGTIEVTFPDSTLTVPTAKGLENHRSNFILGNDPSHWVSGVRHYRYIVYEDLYPGIDLEYSATDGMLKYQFIVKTGADPDQIMIDYNGADSIARDEDSGDLIIELMGHEIRDVAPITYQERGTYRIPVESEFYLIDDLSVKFRIDDFDNSLPLIIDPGLNFSTYFGGGSQDDTEDMALDSNNNIYVTGTTMSRNFTVTDGAFNKTNSGNYDGYVYKLNANGTQLEYSTYIGGSLRDYSYGIEVDAKGCAWICGYTNSADFPITQNAYKSSVDGEYEGYFLRLGPSGSVLEYSSYFGGRYSDIIYSLFVEGTDRVILAGWTASNDFPTTSGSFDESISSDYADAFISKFNTTINSIVFSTFIGGSENDYIKDIAEDTNGSIYVTGTTRSRDFPSTPGSVQPLKQSTDQDVFVLKLEPDGSALEYSTFMGGSSHEHGSSIYVDSLGTASVGGYTYGGGFPTTSGAYDETYNLLVDGILFRINESGSSLLFSTYLGSNRNDYIYDVVIDEYGRPSVSGRTESWTFPTTPGAFDSTHNGRYTYDAFIARFSANGSVLNYSTYIGGTYQDNSQSIEIGSRGCIYIAGSTSSLDFPTQNDSLFGYNKGSWDTFIAKFDIDIPTFGLDRSPSSTTTGDRISFNITVSDNDRVSNVTVEYWKGNSSEHLMATMNLSDGTTQNGNWNVDVFAWEDSVADIHYIFHANDSAMNGNVTNVLSINVTDNDAASLVDMSPENGSTGDLFDFRLSTYDNLGVDSVTLVYWLANWTGREDNVTMEGELLSGIGNGTYVSDVLSFGNHTLTHFFYYFSVMDISGILNETPTRRVEVVDNDPPLVTNIACDPKATTGDPFRFTVDVEDNIDVNVTKVIYWYGQSPNLTFVLLLEGIDLSMHGNGTYGILLECVKSDSLGPMSYRFEADDGAGNQGSSLSYSVEVIDNDPPILIEDLSDPVFQWYENFTIEVDVRDNVGMSNVILKFRINDGQLQRKDMDQSNVDVNGNGIYSSMIPITTEQPSKIQYALNLSDLVLNWNLTAWRTIRVDDNVKPIFGQDTSDTKGIRGTEYTFRIQVTDNLRVDGVYVNFSTDGENWTYTTMEGGGPYWYKFYLPRHDRGPIRYRFDAMDAGGNWISTENRYVNLENVPPVISTLPIWELTEGETGSIDLSPFIEDGNDADENLTLSVEASHITVDGLVLTTVFSKWEPYFEIEIVVTDGEVTTSDFIVIHMLNVNDPPSIIRPSEDLDAIEDSIFSVQFEAEDEDGDSLLWSDNLDILEIDLASGLILFTPTQEMVGEYTMKITVSDGNGGTDSISVKFTIIATNDSPIIEDLEPSEGSIFELGSIITFWVRASDGDGDPLSYTWTVGTDVIGQERQFNYNQLLVGTHEVTVEVDDGQMSVSRSVIITVNEGEGEADQEEDGFPWYILIFIALVVVVGIVFIMRKKDAPGGDVSP